MKVGFYSPLPPARTGVADYSAALLRALAPLGEVEVNARQADICLYHLGNNRLHAEIYQRALENPGVVVLHDAVLHHFLLGSLSEREYIAEFTYNYGAWSEDLARDLWRQRAGSAADPRYFRYPLLKRVAERSRAVIVHNPGAARMVAQHAPGADDPRDSPFVRAPARIPSGVRGYSSKTKPRDPAGRLPFWSIRAFARIQAPGERVTGIQSGALGRGNGFVGGWRLCVDRSVARRGDPAWRRSGNPAGGFFSRARLLALRFGNRRLH